jgi:hypothetical protein
MYERPGLTSDLTYHDLRQRQLAAGRAEPLMIGSLNLDTMTIATGTPIGLSVRPGPQWRRLRWSELADRLDVPLGDCPYPPSGNLNSGGSCLVQCRR